MESPSVPITDDLIKTILTEAPDATRLELVVALDKRTGLGFGESALRMDAFLRIHPAYIGPKRVPAPHQKMPPYAVAGGCAVLAVMLTVFLGTLFAPPPTKPAKTGGGPDWTSVVLAGLAFGVVGYEIRRRKFLADIGVYRGIRPLVVAQNFGILVVVAAVAFGLRFALPFLDRSWLYLLPGAEPGGMNILMAPMHWRIPGIVFLLLLIPVLPRFAADEERRYREGTRDWRHGALRSLRFGLVHCWMGVPIYAGLALGVGGLWFTHQYFRGGVARSTLHHATYNLIIVVIALAVLVFPG